MKIILIILNILFSVSAFSESFVVGTGSEFKMSSNGANSKVSIYISESSFTNLGIEYFFTTSGFIEKKMWQQFTLRLQKHGPLIPEAAYVKTPELDRPEKLTPDYANVNNGVKLDQFFFSNSSELDKYKLGSEKIEVPAGNLIATHYRKSNNGQIVDFWISDKVKPIGLVKLISKNPKNKLHNYELELVSLLRNVKPKIDPKKAVPLTQKGKEALGVPLKK